MAALSCLSKAVRTAIRWTGGTSSSKDCISPWGCYGIGRCEDKIVRLGKRSGWRA